MKTVATLAAIIALGLGLRLAEAVDGRPPVYDAQAYATIAAKLEAGDGFTLGETATQPASNYSPGLPLLVAALYEVAGGEQERFARIVLALVGTLAVLFAFLIGRRLGGATAGLIGAAAVAIYPALVEYQGMLMGEPLAATLLAGAVLSVLWANAPGARVLSRQEGGLAASPGRTPPPTAPPARYWLLPGLLLGALALVRPEYLGIAVLVAVVVAARQGLGGWRGCGVQAAVLLLGVVVVVAPWTVRNAMALDRFVPISTGGGQVLFAGSYLPSDGNPERVGEEVLERHPELRGELPRDPRLEQILAALAGQRFPEMETDAALARMGRERIGDAVTEEPLDFAGFLVAKTWRTWSPGPRDVMREPVWAVLHWLLLGLGLAGLALLARQRRWEALLLGVVLLAVTASGALLVASPRRVLVVVPLLAALAGVGAAWLLTRIRD
jgi:Dolichyl-phosphate-mannose-protein mannosyltransferase